MKLLSNAVSFLYTLGLFHILYGIVMWFILVAGTFLVLKDLWTAMGVVSAYILYGIVNAVYKKEINDAYLERVRSYVESDEAQGE